MAKKEGPSYQDIFQQITRGEYSNLYFLTGEEPFFIDQLTDYLLSHVLSETEREFDQQVFYGKDFEKGAAPILTLARRYPMLGQYLVIAVKEAQLIDGLEDDLAVYLQNPSPTTILIINYKDKKLDGRKKLSGMLSRMGVYFHSTKLYENQIPDWIAQLARQRGLKIEDKACQMLAEFLGNDLGRIASEMGKLEVVLPPKGTVTAEVVEQNVGISKDYNNFELLNALKTKDLPKAQKIAWYYARNPKDHPLQLTTVVLFDFFSKLLIYHYLVDKSPNNVMSQLGVPYKGAAEYQEASGYYTPRQVMRNVSLIRQYDARSKGFAQAATDPGELLRELLCLLMA